MRDFTWVSSCLRILSSRISRCNVSIAYPDSLSTPTYREWLTSPVPVRNHIWWREKKSRRPSGTASITRKMFSAQHISCVKIEMAPKWLRRRWSRGGQSHPIPAFHLCSFSSYLARKPEVQKILMPFLRSHYNGWGENEVGAFSEWTRTQGIELHSGEGCDGIVTRGVSLRSHGRDGACKYVSVR